MTGDAAAAAAGAFSKNEMMIVAAARELAGQRVCFVGVGLPNIAVNLAQRTVAPDLELVYEAGVFGARRAGRFWATALRVSGGLSDWALASSTLRRKERRVSPSWPLSMTNLPAWRLFIATPVG